MNQGKDTAIYVRVSSEKQDHKSQMPDLKRWAELADVGEVSVGVSLDLLGALHRRWVGLLRSLSTRQLRREFVHPESGVVRLDVNVGI